jgi:hypothetical protein
MRSVLTATLALFGMSVAALVLLLAYGIGPKSEVLRRRLPRAGARHGNCTAA